MEESRRKDGRRREKWKRYIKRVKQAEKRQRQVTEMSGRWQETW